MKAPAAPARRDSGADDLMSKLVDESLELGKHGCPNCHARMKQSQTICVNCGFNRESGKMLRTVEQKPVVLKQARAKGSGNRWGAGASGPSLWRMLLVSAAGQTVIAAFALQGLTGAWGSAGFLLLLTAAFTIMGVTHAFMEGETLWALCGISLIIPVLNGITVFGFWFYIFFVCESRSLKTAVGGNVIAWFMWGVFLVVGAVIRH